MVFHLLRNLVSVLPTKSSDAMQLLEHLHKFSAQSGLDMLRIWPAERSILPGI